LTFIPDAVPRRRIKPKLNFLGRARVRAQDGKNSPRSADLTAAGLIWLVTCSTANGQTGPGGADSYTLMIEAICRNTPQR